MEFNPLHNFISPVTGRVLSDPDYVLVGNKDGVAIPSPILIDIRLDLQIIQNEINTLTPLLNLTNGMLWLGDVNNKPVVTKTINIDNLPTLGTTIIPNPLGGFIGKVWEGTADGRPEESSIVGEMFADVAVLNLKFLAGAFIMNSGLRLSYPRAQFLDELTAGTLIKTSTEGDGNLESLVLTQDQILMGGVNNAPESRAQIELPNLPNLNNGKIWKGDINNRPTEFTPDHAPDDATYILKQPNQTLTNAQAISDLASGILKGTSITGELTIASGGKTPIVDDYVRPIDLQEEILEAEAAATAEAAAAEIGAIASSTLYFNEQMLPYSLIPLVPAGASIGASIIAATVGKEDSSSHDLDIGVINNTIDNLSINLVGEVKGTGKIKSPIQTKVGFSFFSKADIPLNPHLGMLLFVEK